MKYISVCSGIEAATVAWHGLGWEPVAFAEIEPFPSAVLAHHYPDVPNLGDMTAFKEWQVDAFDVLVGGTPCQAFSVAGLRQSLDDARGNLSLVFCEMADHFDPPYIIWENVPGVLNTKDNAFGCFLAGLAGEDVPLVAPGGKWTNTGFVHGPKRNVAWRILDAQYFGLAQRRRRVFIVACPRDGADPCEILFEREGVQRHSAPSREKGEGVTHDVAPCIGASGRGFERGGDTRGQDPVVACCREVSPTLTNKMQGSSRWAPYNEDAHLVPVCMAHGQGNAEIVSDGSPSLTCNHEEPIAFAIQERAICENPLAGPDGVGVRADDKAYTLEARSVPQAVCFGGDIARTLQARHDSSPCADRGMDVVAFEPGVMSRCGGHVYEDHAGTLRKEPGDNQMCVAFHQNQRAEVTLNDTAGSLKVGGGKPGQGYPAVQQGMCVRRLVPTECERLQGFPDGYTAIPWRNKPASECPDGPRYKALGNSMAVPVIRWIGWRIGLTKRNP